MLRINEVGKVETVGSQTVVQGRFVFEMMYFRFLSTIDAELTACDIEEGSC
jgi:hypothetical protein